MTASAWWCCVALLPMLDIDGMQLLKAETPGQIKRRKAYATHYRNCQGAVAGGHDTLLIGSGPKRI
jgi:hypothetical protein